MQHPLHIAAATSGLGRAYTVSLLLTADPDAVTAIGTNGEAWPILGLSVMHWDHGYPEGYPSITSVLSTGIREAKMSF